MPLPRSFSALVVLLLLAAPAFPAEDTGVVAFSIEEKNKHGPLACRIHVTDKAGKAQRGGTRPFWFDHFVCPGTARVDLAPGEYTYVVERGPEYAPGSGTFTVRRGETAEVRVVLERLIDMTAE